MLFHILFFFILAILNELLIWYDFGDNYYTTLMSIIVRSILFKYLDDYTSFVRFTFSTTSHEVFIRRRIHKLP
jgi:hypothetical protein